MKARNIFFLIGLISLLYGCAAKLQKYDLSEVYAPGLHYEGSEGSTKTAVVEEEKSDLAGVPFRNFYGGDLKRGGIWFGGKGITLEKGEIFTFDAENVGPDSIPFGATFQPIDLIKEEVKIKISARTAGGSPTLYLQLNDAEGYNANAKWPSQKIEASEEFHDYYFDLKDMFMQSFPKKHKVNGAFINGIRFFINPGQAAFTGQLFIREIKIVAVAPAK